MIKYLKRILLFLFLFTCFYLLLILSICTIPKQYWYYLREYTNIQAGAGQRGNNTLSRLQEIEDYSDIDVLFIGSSHCYRGFDSRIFLENGYKIFNLGTTAQAPLNSYFLLKKYIKKLRPKLVVMDIYWEVFEDDGSESFLNLSINSNLNLDFIEMGIRTKNIQTYNTFLFSFIFSKVYSIDSLKIKNYLNDIYISGGFVESKKTGFRYLEDDFQIKNINIKELQIRYLERIINLVDQNKSRLILVSTPVFEDYLLKVKNYDSFSNHINTIAKVNEVNYFDFNKNSRLGKKDLFFDKDHLNQIGVNVFNTFFLTKFFNKN